MSQMQIEFDWVGGIALCCLFEALIGRRGVGLEPPRPPGGMGGFLRKLTNEQ